MTQHYNGWTNYETWAVGLYLDGNYTGEGTYREVLELAEQHRDDAREQERDKDDTVYTLAGALQEYVEQEVFGDDAPASIATDLLRAAICEVNWDELAEAKLNELADES